MEIKRVTYVLLFTLLGTLVSFLLHALVEIPMIGLLVNDFDRYSLGLSWSNWESIHTAGSVILILVGVGLGYLQGVYWWRQIYVLKRWNVAT